METLTAPGVGFERGSRVSPCTNVVSAAMPSPVAPVASPTTLVVIASFDVVVGGLALGLEVPYISVDQRLRYDTYWHGLVAGEEGGVLLKIGQQSMKLHTGKARKGVLTV